MVTVFGPVAGRTATPTFSAASSTITPRSLVSATMRGTKSGRLAGRLQRGAQLARPGERDHRLGAERAQRYLAAAGEQAAECRHRLAPAIGRPKRRPCVRQQGLAGRGQPGPAPVADEQVLAELGFQPADPLADGRLRDRDPLGRAREVVLLGDGYEVGKLPQFHKKSLC